MMKLYKSLPNSYVYALCSEKDSSVFCKLINLCPPFMSLKKLNSKCANIALYCDSGTFSLFQKFQHVFNSEKKNLGVRVILGCRY